MKRTSWLLPILFYLFLVSPVDAKTKLITTIEPEEASASGAGWRLDNEDMWRPGGTVLAGVPEGTHTIRFMDIPGWTKPADRTVMLIDGRTTLVTGTYTMEGGALQVRIAPQEAIDAGAMWRRVGTDSWRESNDTETGIPPGEYWVEFKEAPGFETPPAKALWIAEGETTVVDVFYPAAEPALEVLLYPPEAAAQGARWRVDGGEWRESGHTLKGLPLGDHLLEFKSVSGWITPPNQTVSIVSGQTTHATGTYIPSSTLCVTLAPQEAVDAGARWRMEGGPWLPSDRCVPLPPGIHLIEFKEVEHWTSPPSQSAASIDGQTVRISGIYVFSAGCLEVLIEPEDVVAKGAKWRVDGGLWFDSGQRVFLSQGEHALEFCDVPGWIRPPETKVMLPSVECIRRVEAYTPAPLSGSLRVMIAPPEAVAAGAQWRRSGTDIWRGSGEPELVPPGLHTVEFKPLSTWKTPPNQDAFVGAGEVVEITGTYILPASLCVTILPPEAIRAGAKWRVDAGPWRESGYVETGLTVGLHTVSFATMSGWTKPADRTVTTTKDETQTLTAVYRPQTGSLRVTINPPEAAAAGAAWRRTGTEVWRKSGTTETGIPVGSHTIEFSDLAGWVKPANRTILIAYNRVTGLTETYRKKTGSLRVMIGPPEAVSAGAKWRRSGTTLWQDSGTTESDVPVGLQTVEFKTIGGWMTPASQKVMIEEDQRTETGAIYTPASGSLQVVIAPQAAIDLGAKWRVDGGPWQESGTTLSGLSVGFHTVSFSTVTGWTKPPNKTVTISKGGTTILKGNYRRAR